MTSALIPIPNVDLFILNEKMKFYYHGEMIFFMDQDGLYQEVV